MVTRPDPTRTSLTTLRSTFWRSSIPSKGAVAAIKAKARALTPGGTNQPVNVLLRRLNPVLRGRANYFRHRVSKATFGYLNAHSWKRIVIWLRHKHPRASWSLPRRRHLPGWRPTEDEVALFNPMSVPVTRYRYRAARVPSPWPSVSDEQVAWNDELSWWRAGCV